MNKQKLGKILIGVGILLVLLYLIFVVFKVSLFKSTLPAGDQSSNPFTVSPSENGATTSRPVGGTSTPLPDTEPEITSNPNQPVFYQITDFPVTVARLYATEKTIEQQQSEEVESTDSDGNITKQVVTKTVPVIERTPYVRYNQKADGVIYDANIKNPLTIERTRLTAPTAYQAQEGIITKDLNKILLRFWDPQSRVIRTSLIILNKKSDSTTTGKCSFDLPTTRKEGYSGKDVENAQTVLLRIGLPTDSSTITPGLYDANMTELIKQFQRSVSQKDDGIMGKNTRLEILNQCAYQEELLKKKDTAPQDPELSTVTTTFFADNISDVAYNETTDTFFSLIPSKTGTVGETRDSNGNNKKEVFRSPFTEWIPFWTSANSLILQTKSSYTTEGYAYNLTIADSKLHNLDTMPNGFLVNPSPDGKKILESYLKNSTLQMIIKDTTKNTKTSLTIQTLPEKCIWSHNDLFLYCAVPDALSSTQLPDTWYQGITRFTDSIWKINTETGSASKILTPSDYIPGASLDMTQLSFSPTEDILIMKDKTTEFLYGYNVTVDASKVSNQ